MFNPRQPRDTGGQWVRIGRGELEQMIDALVQPRAAHIAEINGKPGTAHRKVVARDIKARILKPVKVAPTYHVRIQADGVRNVQRVEINAKGTDEVVRANIPEKKRHGNVDVVARRAGAPAPERIVNKAQADAVSAPNGGGETAAAKERIKKAAGTSVPGLTDVAKRVAGKEREKRRPPATTKGGKTEQLREIEAAVAAKAIKKAQGDRLKALVTLHPPGPGGSDPAEYWQEVGKRVLRRGGQGKKANLDAIQAIKAHLGGGGGVGHNGQELRVGDLVRHFQSGGNGHVIEAINGNALKLQGEPVEVHAGNFSRVGGARANAAGLDPGVEKLLIHVGGAHRAEARKLFEANPKQLGESTYEYIKRVRLQVGNGNAGLLDGIRRMRAVAREQRPQAGVARGGRLPRAPRRQGTAEPAKPQSLPEGEQWLMGEITNIRALGKRGGINETKKGNIGGKLVFIKPQKGAFEQQVHPGIPPGNDAGRERAAYLVGKAMGMDNLAPVVVREVPNEGKAIVQGGVGNGDAIALGIPRTPSAKQDKRMAALYDMVIGNMDRHHGNIRVSGDRVHPIDQGLSFAEGKNDRGGWNHGFAQDYWSTSLTGEEIAMLQRLLNDETLWQKVRGDGLPGEAVKRAQRRIKWMIRNRTMLKSPRQLGGNTDALDGIS